MVTSNISADNNPFRVELPAPHPAWQQPARFTSGALEHVLQLSRLNQLYSELRERPDTRSFPERMLDFMGVRTELEAGDLADIPRTGPVVVVANHPFGGIEGVVLARIFHDVRPDMRVLANHLLARIPELREFMIFVNPFGGAAAARQNMTGLKAAIRWLQNGGMLVTFPAGEVARFDLRVGRVDEGPWNENIARIIRHAGATVLPVHIEGANGPLFHMAGLVHPRLRTALLPQELLNKFNSIIRVRLGRAIAFDRLSRLSSDAAVIRYLRLRTEALAYRSGSRHVPEKPTAHFCVPWKKSAVQVSIAAAVDANALRSDMAALSEEDTILRHEQFRVVVARAAQLPAVLPEIGRLRELTFRPVGEGTGRARDLDRFDAHYLHLLIWNEETSEVVGAYRLGPTDEILPRYGLRGLYTSTLFKFRQPLMKHLTPALELGRSFVRPEYQRGYLPLLLLWKGVCCFVSRNPRYRHLFGPVSISNEYQPISRHLIQRHFPRTPQAAQLARWVSPRHPLRASWPAHLPEVPADLAGDLQTLAELIEEIENGRGLPVLLRQYLKLGGEVLAFNVDPDFHQALDGLIVVDLVHADATAIGRYMGAENLKRYHAFHAAHA